MNISLYSKQNKLQEGIRCLRNRYNIINTGLIVLMGIGLLENG